MPAPGGVVCLWRGVPAPGGVCLWRGCLLLGRGGLPLEGGACSLGVCLWRGEGVCLWREGGACSQGGGIPACTEADPPVNRITHMSKNITLATTSL